MLENSIKIRMQGRSGIIYEKDDDFLKIGGEIVENPIGFLISENSIKKWTKSGQIISEEEKEKIIKNIRDYFSNQGASLVVLPPSTNGLFYPNNELSCPTVQTDSSQKK